MRVETRKGVCGGKPVIKDHRVPVWQVAKLYKEGASVEEISRKFADIGEELVAEAIEYYQKNKEEIEEQIERNTGYEVLEQYDLPNAKILNGSYD